MKNFRTLNLAIAFYQEAKDLKLPQVMRDQFQRALLSIPLNLSEGSAKPTRRDRKKFYSIALGSFREVETILKLSGEEQLLEKSDQLGAHLYRLCQRV